MAISASQVPVAARAAANAVFADRQLPADHDFSDLRGEDAEIGSLPIYNLAVSDLAASRFDGARLTGWRYVRLQRNGRIGDTVEVDLAEDPAIVSHAGGETAARMRDAGIAAVAEVARHDAASADYDARILRVPEIGIEALWLAPLGRDARPRFFGLSADQTDMRNEAFVEFAAAAATDCLGRLAGLRGGA